MFDDIDRDEWLDDTTDLFVETLVGAAAVTAMILLIALAVAVTITRAPRQVGTSPDESA